MASFLHVNLQIAVIGKSVFTSTYPNYTGHGQFCYTVRFQISTIPLLVLVARIDWRYRAENFFRIQI